MISSFENDESDTVFSTPGAKYYCRRRRRHLKWENNFYILISKKSKQKQIVLFSVLNNLIKYFVIVRKVRCLCQKFWRKLIEQPTCF